MTTIFSNLRKLLLDRQTASYIASNMALESIEGLYIFDQKTPSAEWVLKHNFSNPNYIINIYVTQDDGTYDRAYPSLIQSDNTTITLDFDGFETIGYACVLFAENDLGIIPSQTAAPTVTPTPTPTHTGTSTPLPTPTSTQIVVSPTMTPTPSAATAGPSEFMFQLGNNINGETETQAIGLISHDGVNKTEIASGLFTSLSINEAFNISSDGVRTAFIPDYAGTQIVMLQFDGSILNTYTYFLGWSPSQIAVDSINKLLYVAGDGVFAAVFQYDFDISGVPSITHALGDNALPFPWPSQLHDNNGRAISILQNGQIAISSSVDVVIASFSYTPGVDNSGQFTNIVSIFVNLTDGTNNFQLGRRMLEPINNGTLYVIPIDSVSHGDSNVVPRVFLYNSADTSLQDMNAPIASGNLLNARNFSLGDDAGRIIIQQSNGGYQSYTINFTFGPLAWTFDADNTFLPTVGTADKIFWSALTGHDRQYIMNPNFLHIYDSTDGGFTYNDINPVQDVCHSIINTRTNAAAFVQSFISLTPTPTPSPTVTPGIGTNYRLRVTNDNPSYYWTFDGDTTVAHDLIAGNDGTKSGTSVSIVNGGLNQCLSNFPDAISGFTIATTFDIDPSTASCTFEAWVKPDSTMHGNFGSMLGATGGGSGFQIFCDTSTSVLYYYADAGNGSTAHMTNDNWHHVVAIINSNTVFYYIDGAFAGSETASGLDIQTIGWLGTDGGNENFPGLCDEIAFYPYVLTADQIQLHYHAGLGQFT